MRGYLQPSIDQEETRGCVFFFFQIHTIKIRYVQIKKRVKQPVHEEVGRLRHGPGTWRGEGGAEGWCSWPHLTGGRQRSGGAPGAGASQPGAPGHSGR